MAAPFVRNPYNYDMNKAGDESGLKCKDPTLTQQHFKEEVDINTLVERFNLTGQMPQIEHLPTHADFEGIFDFQTAMNAIVAARETFDSLPAKLRYRFHNGPAEFVDFCSDPENVDEAVKLGLADKKPEEPLPPQPQPTEKQGKTPETPKVTQ